MCGIAGIIDRSRDVVEQAVPAMNRAQAHRGPDDDGTATLGMQGGWLGFGHRRLAVIDVSPSGHQPMFDTIAGNCITFNGEIYNFRELRSDLERRGQAFRTQTDTEVILKAYAVWGIDCVKRLRGIFAFGLWDPSRQLLLLARDPLGVKPLYLFERDQTLLFASEVRAMLATELIDRKLCQEGLLSYLAYGSVQEPFTMIRDIRSLPAGHCLVWEHGTTSVRRYWNLPSPDTISETAPQDLYMVMSQRLKDAVGSQLVSDVPLGVFLSGGLDSTAIAALASQAATTPIRTFSVVFQESKYDERRWSNLVAKHIGSEHTEIELTGDQLLQWLPQIVNAFDEPSADGINTFVVSKLARESGMTVALSGLGGDEVFGGYNGFRKALLIDRLFAATRLLPPMLRHLISSGLDSLNYNEGLRKLSDLLETKSDPHLVSRRLFSKSQIHKLLNQKIPVATSWEEEAFGAMTAQAMGYDTVNRISAFELQTYMQSTLLRDTDQMSMAHALEVRVPLIDSWLVEFCFTLPGNCKVDQNSPKPLISQSIRNIIPQEIISRPKMGFELPFEQWLRQGLKGELTEIFHANSSEVSWPFEFKGFASIWGQFQAGRLNWSRVWALYVLRKWMRHNRVTC
jgi:asparagine synthase (glutamine-hydrolysing)